MAPIASASPFRPRSRAATRNSPSPPPVPPKTTTSKAIDLSSSTTSTDRATVSKITRRAVVCDVVVERDGEETTTLLAQLGHTVDPLTALPPLPQPPLTPSRKSQESDSDLSAYSGWTASKRDEMEKRLQSLIEEFVRTEKSYISRIKALKTSYADPLRHFAKQGYSVIIPAYEAKILFSNIDAVLPAATTFLDDLEEMWASGQAENLVGDVCLKHLKTLKTLDPYRTYIANQDEAQKTFQEMFKKVPTFVSFIDSTKYQTTGIGNIGLRELLMEPVQRVPRYTLLWQSMAKCMSPLSDQRMKLTDATEIASRIARCETDEQTVRATVQYCLQRNVEGFPANLFSNNRDFVDSIDAEDVLEPPGSARPGRQGSMVSGKVSTPLGLGGLGSPTGAEPSASTLHCTLFLFDDKLLITKRVTSGISGRKVTGLDDVRQLVKTGGGVAVREKDGTRKERLSFRGAVDIEDVVAMDMGNGDFQIFYDLSSKADSENPLADQTDKWSATRPLRQYITVHPPHPIGFDPVTSCKDKLRFVHNIWAAQALRRTKLKPAQVKPVPRGVLACNDEIDLDKGSLLRVKPYWNVWDRAGWVGAQEKAKVVIQIAEDEDIPELPLPQESGPTLIIRLEPMPGAVCKLMAVTNTGTQVYRTASALSEVNKKIVEAIHEGGLFKVNARNRSSSIGGTPGSILSKRASRVFGSDGIARNLWGGSTSSTRAGNSSEGFGSSSTKRSQSIKSRSSTLTRASTDITSISSAGSSYPPKSPRSPSESTFSDLRDNAPMSPVTSPVKAEPRVDTDGLDARLNLARYNSRSQASITSPAMVSRVAAMRDQLERKMMESTSEEKESSSTPPPSVSIPSPSKLRRGPIPTLASSILSPDGGMSRDSSMNSLPQSPTRNGTLSRSGTMSPRGPRTPKHARGGYVPPLPPPVPGEYVPRPSPGRSPARSPANRYPPAPSPASVLPKVPAMAPSARASPEPAFKPPAEPVGEVVDLTDVSTVGHEPIRRYTLHDPPVRDYSSPTTALRPPSPAPTAPASPQQRPVRALPQSPDPSTLPKVASTPSANAVAGRLLGLGAPPRSPHGGRSPSQGLDDESSRTPSGSSAQKRQHPADHLSPRKRSTSDSPMSHQNGDGGPISETRPPSILGPATGARRTSGVNVVPKGNRRVSAGAPRHVSTASSMTVQSIGSAATVDDTDIVMSDHAELPAAADSTRQRVADARKLARRLRTEATTCKRLFSGEATRGPMLPRSPQTVNIQTVLSSSDNLSDKSGAEIDDLMQSVVGLGEKLEQKLAGALADSERVRMLARTTADSESQMAASVATLEGQVTRAKEREALLNDQLRRRDLEVEEIYNAFNAELDGMYNDMTLVQPDEAMAAMRRDLQEAKAKRNAFELENSRLRMELEEERLKREQWHALLQPRGLLP